MLLCSGRRPGSRIPRHLPRLGILRSHQAEIPIGLSLADYRETLERLSEAGEHGIRFSRRCGRRTDLHQAEAASQRRPRVRFVPRAPRPKVAAMTLKEGPEVPTTLTSSHGLFCPRCLTLRVPRIDTRPETYPVRGQAITVDAAIAVCPECGEELDSELEEENLARAYDEYRRLFKIAAPDDIRRLRGRYDLSQRGFARLLGRGPITVISCARSAICLARCGPRTS
jgi:putative zinc finger/helix-turn-helix YgiT family protein